MGVRQREITPAVEIRIHQVVLDVAKKHDVPPVYITAHTRKRGVDEARKEVWRKLISEVGLTRGQVAEIFGRDLRRLRKSVIGV